MRRAPNREPYSPVVFCAPTFASLAPIATLLFAPRDPISSGISSFSLVVQGTIPALSAALVLLVASMRLRSAWVARPLWPYAVLAGAYAIASWINVSLDKQGGGLESSSSAYRAFVLCYALAIPALPLLGIPGGIFALYRSNRVLSRES
jgi:hypothetical protein